MLLRRTLVSFPPRLQLSLVVAASLALPLSLAAAAAAAAGAAAGVAAAVAAVGVAVRSCAVALPFGCSSIAADSDSVGV